MSYVDDKNDNRNKKNQYENVHTLHDPAKMSCPLLHCFAILRLHAVVWSVACAKQFFHVDFSCSVRYAMCS